MVVSKVFHPKNAALNSTPSRLETLCRVTPEKRKFLPQIGKIRAQYGFAGLVGLCYTRKLVKGANKNQRTVITGSILSKTKIYIFYSLLVAGHHFACLLCVG
jgi:hypothetical protein